MEADFWHERWDKNQIGFHQDTVNSHLQDFWGGLELDGRGKIFVPLCGKSADMLWLRAQGHEVLGIELSALAIKDFFAENDLEPQVSQSGKFERWECDGIVIYQGDFFDLTPDDLAECAGVFDRASLIALPPEMRSAYTKHLKQIVPKQCDVLLVTMEYDQSLAGGPPFSVMESEVREYYEGDYSVTLLRSVDALNEMSRFKKMGMPRLDEKTFLLR
ncbi:MAG: Thiopurine S-methyltransferase (EC [uncultured Thiotrichaceae bacterium]|uniref:Thiopurine S-methyltransferase n=1 Tax=uncultured Thiotrichaceae bacterium TaxID=298394 RepID=A0A6S6TN83_9GAMM|nr:MAG: Thiopurine S-methyltransferase (EC [uncultured Thiotrichaceae bacterium]